MPFNVLYRLFGGNLAPTELQLLSPETRVRAFSILARASAHQADPHYGRFLALAQEAIRELPGDSSFGVRWNTSLQGLRQRLGGVDLEAPRRLAWQYEAEHRTLGDAWRSDNAGGDRTRTLQDLINTIDEVWPVHLGYGECTSFCRIYSTRLGLLLRERGYDVWPSSGIHHSIIARLKKGRFRVDPSFAQAFPGSLPPYLLRRSIAGKSGVWVGTEAQLVKEATIAFKPRQDYPDVHQLLNHWW